MAFCTYPPLSLSLAWPEIFLASGLSVEIFYVLFCKIQLSFCGLCPLFDDLCPLFGCLCSFEAASGVMIGLVSLKGMRRLDRAPRRCRISRRARTIMCRGVSGAQHRIRRLHGTYTVVSIGVGFYRGSGGGMLATGFETVSDTDKRPCGLLLSITVLPISCLQSQ